MAEQAKKTGQIQIFAKNIRGVASGGILEESKFTRNLAGGRHVQNGTGGGVNNDVNNPRTTTEKTRVKTVVCLDTLDDGSANDGSGTNIKKGILYNKTYRFRIKEYTNGEPKNPNSIRWALKFKHPETGQVELNILQNKDYRGTQLNVNFIEREICGSDLEVRAYIENAESEGKLFLFHHNRFRWFDSKILKKDIEARKNSAWLIDQDKTNTCGPSAIMYAFAKKDKENYAKFIKNLHRTGYVKYNNYEIDIDSDGDLESIANTDPNKTADFPLSMASCDWIPNTCITDKENAMFDYEGDTDEDFSAITLPSRISMLSRNLLGFTDVVDNTNLYFNKTGLLWGATLEDIAELIKAKEEGYEIFLLIGINMLYGKTSNSMFSSAEHWIVLESVEHGEMGFAKLKLYTWGRNPKSKEYNISYDVFRTNYYGYVKSK